MSRDYSELKRHIETLKDFKALRHPLVYMVPYFGSQEELDMAFEMLNKKKAKLNRLIQSRDYFSYISLHEKPHRFDALRNAVELFSLNIQEISSAARDVWIGSENIHQNRNAWKMFLTNFCDAQYFMSEEDKRQWDLLPDQFSIYRSANSMSTMSWSLSEDVAIWFANRFSRPFSGVDTGILVREISKSDAWAFTNERGESEVIII